ncbi:O-antigen ligase family protein [Vulgatibacter sp.]|uniref:O-antigen ligase family protein n=1 Tax=Vulgatibacter sp. TaxID=1971226 RepID=UPI0035649E6F
MEAQQKNLGTAAEAVAAAVLVGAPLALGAVHLSVSLVVAAFGCLSFLLLALSLRGRRLHVGWLAPLLLLVNVVAALQLLPLPPGLVGLLAPETAALYQAAGVKGWHPLSLDAAATAAEVAKGIGWLCLFVVLQHRAGESKRARKRIFAYVAGAAALVALVGLGNWVVGEKQSLLGLYEFSGTKPFLSTFGNTNNLSGFLNLGGLLALGLAAQADRIQWRVAWGAVFLACVGGSILTASRGGAMALLAGLLLLPILGWGSRARKSEGSAESWRSWATIGGATAVASAIAWWLYSEFPRLLREVASLLDFNVADEQGKLEAYKIAWDAALAHPFFGIGRGAFHSVQALYLSQPWRVTFTHAENEPLQALAELGLPVGALLVLGFAAAWLGLVRRGRLSWAEAGAAAGAFALLLQNLVDFSLQSAAGLALLALFAHHVRREVRVRFAPVLACAVAAPLLVGLAGARAWPEIDRVGETLVAFGADQAIPFDHVEAELRAAWAERPAWYLPAEIAAARAAAEEDGAKRALPWVNQLLRLNPQAGSGHLLAGETLARLGAKGQALAEFRTAASLGRPSIERVLAWWPDDAEAVRAGVPAASQAALVAAGPVEKSGQRALAIELLERIEEPDLRVLGRLFWLRRAEGDHEAALALAERLRPLEEQPARALALQALALRALQRPDDARARYEEALGLDRRSTDALFGLAELEIEQKRYAEAIETLERIPVAAHAGAQNTRHWLRSRAFRADKSLLKARDELRLLVGRVPDNQWYRLTLVDVLLDLGQLDEAATTLEPLADWDRADGARKRLAQLVDSKRQREMELLEQRLLGTTP